MEPGAILKILLLCLNTRFISPLPQPASAYLPSSTIPPSGPPPPHLPPPQLGSQLPQLLHAAHHRLHQTHDVLRTCILVLFLQEGGGG